MARTTRTSTKATPVTPPSKKTIVKKCLTEDAIARGGVACPFPWKLHEMLDDAEKEGNEDIVQWMPHGKSFLVHKPKEFVARIMPAYFSQTKYASFQRQLNLYGFCRLTHGKDKGAYFHRCFQKGERNLCRGMVRQKIKGTKVRRTLAPEEEPNFYSPEWNEQSYSCIPPLAPAVRARQQRLQLVQDVLEQTASLFDDDEDEEDPFARDSTIFAPVSPAESEDSSMADSEDSSCATGLPSSPPKLSLSFDDTKLLDAPVLPLVPKVRKTPFVQGGDILFFEGKPFHYLEHLDSLPPLPSGCTSSCKAKDDSFAFDADAYGFPRDSLQSLMRADPQALMGAAMNICQVP